MVFDPITAGIDFAKDIGGKLISHFFPDPEQASKAVLELNRLAQEGKIQEWVQNNERYRTEVEDRKSARDRESAVVTSPEAPYINKIILPVLAVGVLVLSFVLFGLVVFDNDVIDPSRKDIVIYILGVLSAIDTQIIAYYFGSSSGSVQKTDFMEKLMNK
jgi:hypothetical protein